MPIHDWTRVEPRLFHDFHQDWVIETKRALNQEILPPGYYALSEQPSGVFVPDILALKGPPRSDSGPGHARPPIGGGLLLDEPKVRIRSETALDAMGRKPNLITIRDEEDDELVAVVEVVSRSNKSKREALDAFLKKAAALLSEGIHLLILDLQPPTGRDPQGIHGAIWNRIAEEDYVAPADKPLTLAAYESGPRVRAFVEPVAVGDVLPSMPLFLRPGAHVLVPLERTYLAAWELVPNRWREVVDPGA